MFLDILASFSSSVQHFCEGSLWHTWLDCLYKQSSLSFSFFQQVGSDSYQGAGAPTMFQAIRRIVGSLAQEYTGESAYDRSIRQSFLGKL